MHHTHTHMPACFPPIHAFMHTHTHTCIHVHTHTYIHMYACAHTMYTCAHTYIHTHTCTCTHTHTHTTHTHTHHKQHTSQEEKHLNAMYDKCVHVKESMQHQKKYPPGKFCGHSTNVRILISKLGSVILSQPAFHGERNPDFPWE